MTSDSAFSDYLFLVQFGPAVLKSVAVLAIDLHDPNMEILYASKLLEEMFGYDPGELHGQSLDALLREEDRAVHHTDFALFHDHPVTRSMNKGVWVDAVTKTGRLFKVQVSLTVEPVGKRDCVIACVADVTAAFQHVRPYPLVHGQVEE